MKENFIIGTRGSLLAVTQCTLIKNEIEDKTKAKFSLRKIRTQGDQITDKPLWQLEGKDFFTKELDAALLDKKIDLVVHSYKDLGSERPEGIKLACITERKYGHDILLIKKSKIKELSSLKEVIVGTSSPRRIVNIEKNLSPYLPNHTAKISCKTLRGNVNTRIEKLLNDDYDAIVLALAGLERLASYPDSKQVLEELLKDLTFMVLPQKIFPSSASQGALAIETNETREDNLHKVLSSVHNETSAQEISRERKSFNSYGGGCHLAVGIHVKKVQDYFVHIHHGEVDNTPIQKLELEGYDYSSIKGKKTYYVYGEKDFLIHKKKIENKTSEPMNLFVTSSNCFHNIDQSNSIWAAGNRTMKKLVETGHWVHGSSEGFGHEEIEKFKRSNVINIMLQHDIWKILSHDKASSSVGENIISYTHELNKVKLSSEMKSADIIYWSSFIQYEIYTQQFPELKQKQAACGLGKTLTTFKNANINVIPCIDMNHLKNQL